MDALSRALASVDVIIAIVPDMAADVLASGSANVWASVMADLTFAVPTPWNAFRLGVAVLAGANVNFFGSPMTIFDFAVPKPLGEFRC